MLQALLKLFTRRQTTGPKAPAAPQAASIFDLVGTGVAVRDEAVREAVRDEAAREEAVHLAVSEEAVCPAPRDETERSAAVVERRVLDIRNRFSSVEHYYHFLLGFLTPLVIGPVPENPGMIYVTRSCGPMDAHVYALGLPNIEIVDKNHWRDLVRSVGKTAVRLDGFDDPANYDAAAFARVRTLMLARFGIDADACHDGVLFIMRGDSPVFYQSEECEVKTSANLRRTVPNMVEIAESFTARGVPARTAELELAPLREQVALFAGARILVAQHGAALANMIWMPPGCAVIEINSMPQGSKFRDYFRDLAAACGHRYEVVEQVSHYAPVDPAEIAAALSALGLFEGALAPLA